mmetsp:Transcript_25218/g.39594  ORF Transcript_25218/g.39594 Transcript_25218/m.39594 type:complete len:238 (+) Transcript_25218:158-871(+)
MPSSSGLEVPKGKICGYLTDVEGNFEYFDAYVQLSKVLDWKDERKQQLDLRPGASFCFGGDVVDKGTGDIRVTTSLTDLKKRYPKRVFLIIGNRDGNKMRMATELRKEILDDTLIMEDRQFPYWVRDKDKIETVKDYLAKNPEENGGSENNLANRLRWMLKATMGSDGAFERRRLELQILQDRQKISDDEVVKSFQECALPARLRDKSKEDGFMLQYLENVANPLKPKPCFQRPNLE